MALVNGLLNVDGSIWQWRRWPLRIRILELFGLDLGPVSYTVLYFCGDLDKRVPSPVELYFDSFDGFVLHCVFLAGVVFIGESLRQFDSRLWIWSRLDC